MKNGRYTLFLLEIVLDLVIFVICAAVCTGLLLYAWRLSQDSARLTDAVFYAQTAAETWRTGGQVPQEQDGFAIAVTPGASSQAGVETARVTVSWAGETLYTIEEVARP